MQHLLSTGMKYIALGALGFLLIAYQSYWYADPDFGSTVNNAVRAQTANPNAPQPPAKGSASGLDGVSAKKGVDNYQGSFDAKPTDGDKGSLIQMNIGSPSGSR